MYTKENSPGYRISLLSRLFGPAVNAYYEAFGITFGQIPFILEILEDPGLTQEQLSELVVVDKAAAARTLAALEVQGLLLRKENPDNRRQKLVYPTEKLNQIQVQIKNSVTEINDQFLEGFDASEKEKVLQVLDQLISNCRKIKNEKTI
jgi:DNA-binding MarR family transcriptional regulator